MSITSASPAPENTPASSAITDVSYRNYDGELRTRALRWWTITVATIRAGLSKKFGYWIPVAMTFMVYVFWTLLFYFNKSLQEQMATMGNMMGSPVNPYALTLYQGLSGSYLLVAIAAMVIGSAVIAADNRANALLVYLSKPLSRTDYLLGKWVGVFLLLSALTLAPALLVFLFFVVAYNSEGFLKENPTLILRLLAVTLSSAAIHTSLILGFSAWAKAPRLAGAFYAALYIACNSLALLMGNAFLHKDKENKQPRTTAIVSHLSIDGVISGIATNIYQVDSDTMPRVQAEGRRRRRQKNHPEEKTPPPAPEPTPPSVQPDLTVMLFLAGLLIVVPVAAAALKVRAVEVVRG